MSVQARQSESSARGRKVVMLYSKLFQPHEGWYLRVYNQARALVDSGYDVTLLAWDRTASVADEEVRDGIRIRRLPIRAQGDRGPVKNALSVLRFNYEMLAFLLRNGFDLIECFNVDTMFAGLVAARIRRKKAILDLCEPDYYRGFWDERYEWLLRVVDALERFCAKRFDHLFVHNTYQIRKFHAAGIRHLTQIGSYPNQSLLAPPGEPAPRRGTVIVGRIGSAYSNNGFEEIVLAFQKLIERARQQGNPVQYKLFLAGYVFDTYREKFDSLVASLGEHVEVVGAYDAKDLPDLYRRIDVALLIQGGSAFRNVTPTKLFESMARGVPVIANPIGDMGNILREGNSGLVVDGMDPDSICEAIQRLGSNPHLRRQMAENGMRLVREKYSWEAVRDDFLGTYRQLGVA